MTQLGELREVFKDSPPDKDIQLVKAHLEEQAGELRPYHCVNCIDEKDQELLDALLRIAGGLISCMNYTDGDR